MMTELSLHVLDIAQNSITAGAALIKISIIIDTIKDNLCIEISDDGRGMDEKTIEKVTDPFFTTRTTRDVGLGIPFFKYSAKVTGGSFSIQSKIGWGTTITGNYTLSHIDRMPLGDMVATMHTLITFNTHIHFLYTYKVDERCFILDTREFKEILGDIPLNIPEVSAYIKEYLMENTSHVNEGNFY